MILQLPATLLHAAGVEACAKSGAAAATERIDALVRIIFF